MVIEDEVEGHQYDEQIVPDLAQIQQSVITPTRSSGATTPTGIPNGILMTTKYARGASLLTSGTVTP